MRYDINSMLLLWLLAFASEGLLFVAPYLWNRRRAYIAIPCLLTLAASIKLMLALPWLAGLILLLLTGFRLINLFRIAYGRMHERYLYTSTERTAIWLFLMHVLLFGYLATPQSISQFLTLNLLVLIQLLTAAVFLTVTLKNISKLRFKMPDTFLTDRELPTVSVAIPARNEPDDRTACLRTVLASDYPKLEVLVYDDWSQGKTADIIRSFAQNGVRFVKGEEPHTRWLAKNQAYQKLYESASGELVLFCGVDARLGPGSIRSMVNLMYARRKSMLSILPVRSDTSPASAVIQPTRYWWELSLPRRMFNRPPVLSTCWMIGRQDLKEYGGFAAVSHSILPERYFARKLIMTDQYSFVRSAGELDVKTTKSFPEQYATAIRTRYPQVRRRPELILLTGLASATFLFLPFCLLFASFVAGTSYFWPVLAACLMLTAGHLAIVNATDPANSLLAAVTFPVVALTDIATGFISMMQYEFFKVEWKDRNICIPVMHVYPKLPELPT